MLRFCQLHESNYLQSFPPLSFNSQVRLNIFHLSKVGCLINNVYANFDQELKLYLKPFLPSP